jgi:hypothetical protein
MKELRNGVIIDTEGKTGDTVIVIAPVNGALRVVGGLSSISQFFKSDCVRITPYDGKHTVDVSVSNLLILWSANSPIEETVAIMNNLKEYLRPYSHDIARNFARASVMAKQKSDTKFYDKPEHLSYEQAILKFRNPFATQGAFTRANGEVTLQIGDACKTVPFKVNDSIKKPGELYVAVEEVVRNVDGSTKRNASGKVESIRYHISKDLEAAIIAAYYNWANK